MGAHRQRRYSTEFKLRLVESYLAGEGTAKGLESGSRRSERPASPTFRCFLALAIPECGTGAPGQRPGVPIFSTLSP